MVHSIRLWRHHLGWFTPFGSDATYTWDGWLHPALTPLNPGMVHTIRLWRHLILGWFTPSGFDATTWDGLPHPALMPHIPGMVYLSLFYAKTWTVSLNQPGMVDSIRLWRHIILGWFTHPALMPLNPGMDHSIRLWSHVYLGWLTPSGFDAT